MVDHLQSRVTPWRQYASHVKVRGTLSKMDVPGLRELAFHRITAFPGKLKGVPHSQEDGTNIFPSQLHNMSELCAFHHEHPYFQQIFKDCPKF